VGSILYVRAEFDRGVTGHGGVMCRGWDCVDIPKENYTENKVAL